MLFTRTWLNWLMSILLSIKHSTRVWSVLKLKLNYVCFTIILKYNKGCCIAKICYFFKSNYSHLCKFFHLLLRQNVFHSLFELLSFLLFVQHFLFFKFDNFVCFVNCFCFDFILFFVVLIICNFKLLFKIIVFLLKKFDHMLYRNVWIVVIIELNFVIVAVTILVAKVIFFLIFWIFLIRFQSFLLLTLKHFFFICLLPFYFFLLFLFVFFNCLFLFFVCCNDF